MKEYSLAIAWDWEFDKDFIEGIEQACASRQVSTYRIELHNLEETLRKLQSGELLFHSFYDRASDSNEAFQPVANYLHQSGVDQVNPHDLIPHAADKAAMHLELMSRGLHVPQTIIVAPYNTAKEIDFSEKELERLGKPFVIKPANTTGGGTGVILDASGINDVAEARKYHQNDKYLLQEKILPAMINGRRGWFRVFYAFGEIIPCWWDDHTHHYIQVTSEEEIQFRLKGLRTIMPEIQHVCGLDFFSSEIAMKDDGIFVVVDYVNEICDMRLQSKYADGVPDNIVHAIEHCLANDASLHERRFEHSKSIS